MDGAALSQRNLMIVMKAQSSMQPTQKIIINVLTLNFITDAYAQFNTAVEITQHASELEKQASCLAPRSLFVQDRVLS